MQKVAFLLSLSIFLRASCLTKFLPEVAMIYFIALFVGVIIVSSKKIYLNKLYLSFVFVAIISVIFNDIDPFFDVWRRLGLFILVLYVLGGLNISYKAGCFRRELLRNVMWMSTVFTLLSFVFGILGLSFVENKGFTGIAIHSMTLAPIASISLILNLYCWLNKVRPLYSGSMAVISFLTVFLAASRGALGAVGVACGVLFFCYMKKRQLRGMKYIFLCFVVMLGIVIGNPSGVVDNLYNKIDSREENVLSGRDIMLVDRILDFKDSPLIGVGFASARNIQNTKIDYDLKTLEPGSSLFFILSTMGILGVVCFLAINVRKLMTTLRNSTFDITSIVVLFFFLHSLIEGYAISAGSPLCALMWLFLGGEITVQKLSSKTQTFKASFFNVCN